MDGTWYIKAAAKRVLMLKIVALLREIRQHTVAALQDIASIDVEAMQQILVQTHARM